MKGIDQLLQTTWLPPRNEALHTIECHKEIYAENLSRWVNKIVSRFTIQFAATRDQFPIAHDVLLKYML